MLDELVLNFLGNLDAEILSKKKEYIIFKIHERVIVGKLFDSSENLDQKLLIEVYRPEYKYQIDRIVHFINGSESVIKNDKVLKKEIQSRGAENFFFFEDFCFPDSILAPIPRMMKEEEKLPGIPKIPKTDRLVKKRFFNTGDIIIFERYSRLPGLVCPISMQPFIVV